LARRFQKGVKRVGAVGTAPIRVGPHVDGRGIEDEIANDSGDGDVAEHSDVPGLIAVDDEAGDFVAHAIENAIERHVVASDGEQRRAVPDDVGAQLEVG